MLPSHRLNQECPTRMSMQQAVRLSAPALCCAHSYSIVSRNGDLTISFSSSILFYSILFYYSTLETTLLCVIDFMIETSNLKEYLPDSYTKEKL